MDGENISEAIDGDETEPKRHLNASMEKKRKMEILRKLLGRTRAHAEHQAPKNIVEKCLDSETFTKGTVIAIYVAAAFTVARLLFFPHERSFSFSNYIYIKLLGCMYLDAFVSLWVQIIGLVGSKGIVPMQQTMQLFESYFEETQTTDEDSDDTSETPSVPHSPVQKFLKIPSLFWFIARTDANLNTLCLLGVVFSACLIVGILPAPFLVAAVYIIYLTMMHVTDQFLALQWDVLILETGFLSVFLSMSSHGFSMLHIMPSSVGEPNRLLLFLIWWLLFRLMFSSGLVKLSSRDQSWVTLKAMNYHYQTQPIPGPLSHWVHHRSEFIHKVETVGTFFIELALPFCMFGPRSLQIIAALSFSFLNLTISFTGNYGFFNLHTIVLALTLLDDQAFHSFGDIFNISKTFSESVHYLTSWHQFGLPVINWSMLYSLPLFCLIMAISVTTWNRAFRTTIFKIPSCISKTGKKLSPFFVVNPYGLFAVMTTERIELIIEGSNDGEHWVPYEFKYKPGDLFRRPPFILGHMPRLDWRMWFLPFSRFPAVPSWFIQFLDQIRQGNKAVLDLLQSSPFPPDEPPKMLRVLSYDYKFTSRQELKQKGQYWTRTPKGSYIPFILAKR